MSLHAMIALAGSVTASWHDREPYLCFDSMLTHCCAVLPCAVLCRAVQSAQGHPAGSPHQGPGAWCRVFLKRALDSAAWVAAAGCALPAHQLCVRIKRSVLTGHCQFPRCCCGSIGTGAGLQTAGPFDILTEQQAGVLLTASVVVLD